MILLSISGACSRSGKTAAAVSLLRVLPAGRAAAVKFTTTEDVFERCPRACPASCATSTCRSGSWRTRVSSAKPEPIPRACGEAGASQVVWAIARESAVTSALGRGPAPPLRRGHRDHGRIDDRERGPTGPAGVRRASLALARALEGDLRRLRGACRRRHRQSTRIGRTALRPEVLDALRRLGGPEPIVADVTRPPRSGRRS